MEDLKDKTMKKKYMKPTQVVIDLPHKSQILAGSPKYARGNIFNQEVGDDEEYTGNIR